MDQVDNGTSVKINKTTFEGAYINAEIYIGDDQLDALATIKSREELIGELIGLLQAPAQSYFCTSKSIRFKLNTEAETEHNI
jgi:large subunit ribosomal protein L10